MSVRLTNTNLILKVFCFFTKDRKADSLSLATSSLFYKLSLAPAFPTQTFFLKSWDSRNTNTNTNTHTFDNTPHRLVLPRLPLFWAGCGFTLASLSHTCVSAHLWGVYLVFTSLDTTQH
jgi:hypothetical protein